MIGQRVGEGASAIKRLLLRVGGGLQTRLLALLALALLPPLGITLWQLERAAAARIEAAALGVADTVADLANEHAGLVEEAGTILAVLAQVPAVQGRGPGCNAILAVARAELPWASVIAAASPEGIVTCASEAAVLGIDIADRAYFRAAMESGFNTSGVLSGRVRRRPIVIAARPAFAPGGAVQTVLFASIELGWLARQADRLSHGASDIALVLDATGLVVAANPEAALPAGHPVGALAKLAPLATGGTGLVRTASLDGQARLVGFAPLPGGGGAIVVGRAEAAILAPVRADRRRAHALLLGAALATGLLAWWYGRAGLLRGLDRIVAAARDGRPLAAATPDALATREVQALHTALVADADRRAGIERRWRTLGEAGATIIWRTDPTGRLLEALGWESLVGAAPRTDAGLFCLATAHPDDRAGALATWNDALAAGHAVEHEYRIDVDAGADPPAWRWMQMRAVPVHDDKGAVAEWVGTLHDVSDRQAATAALSESEQRFRLLAENAGDVIILSDLEGTRRYVSPAARRVLGWEPEAMLGLSILEQCHPDDAAWLRCALDAMRDGEPDSAATYRLRRPDGSWLWVDGRARAHLDAAGRPAGYVASVRDATERKAAEQQLLDAFERMEAIAATDGLTGLPNRRRFDEALRLEWRRAARESQPLSLIMLDADRFKLFNDRYGHPAGDGCLQAIAAAIEAAARRPSDLPARIGGEEFALLMPATDALGAIHVAELLREAMLARGLEHAGNPPSGVVTISIGVASAFPWAPEGPGPAAPDALLSLADRALYAATSGGRNRVVLADTLETAAE